METFTYGDIVTDRLTGRIGTFIEFVAPPGTERTTVAHAIVEFGGEPGVPDTGTCEELPL